MTVARNVAEVLAEHVTLEVACLDRLYPNLYQPRLQHELGVVGFFKQPHRDARFVSSVLMDPISKAFVAGLHRFVAEAGVPNVALALCVDAVALQEAAEQVAQGGVVGYGRSTPSSVDSRLVSPRSVHRHQRVGVVVTEGTAAGGEGC